MASKKEYDMEFQKKNYRRIALNLSFKKDADILNALEEKENITEYIKECIRKDIKK